MNKYLEKKDFDTQMNAIDLRFAGLETRFDNLESRFDNLGTRFDGLETRVIRLETEFRTEMKHVATKAWVLGGVTGGMGLAATIAVTFVKLFAE